MNKLSNMLTRIIVIMATLLLTFNLQAQKLEGESFTMPLSDPGSPGKLEFNLIYGSIKVIGSDRKDVVITASKREKNSTPKSRDGMKMLSSKQLEFTVEELKNTVVVHSKPSGTADYVVEVPQKFSLNIKTINNGDIYIENISGDLEVSNTNGKITMENISGSVVADAINQDIKVKFVSVSNNSMAFSTINGDLDITFPPSLKANIKASSQMGDVFTDFEVKQSPPEPIKAEKKDSGVYKITGNKWISGTVNGGGPEILFKTFNGDILIRNKDK